MRQTFNESLEDNQRICSSLVSIWRCSTVGRKWRTPNFRNCNSKASLTSPSYRKELSGARKCKTFLTDSMHRRKSAKPWPITNIQRLVSLKASYVFTLQLVKFRNQTSFNHAIVFKLCHKRLSREAKTSYAMDGKVFSINLNSDLLTIRTRFIIISNKKFIF